MIKNYIHSLKIRLIRKEGITPTSSNSSDKFTMSESNDFYSSNKFKLILLTGMVIQNSAVVLVGRYTNGGVPEEDRYVINHLIVVTEVFKLLLSCVFEHYTSNGQLWNSIQENIVDRPMDALKISIPALLYLLQNTLLYVALANLTAPMFQVTYQTKLVTTAIISVLMLNRKYSPQQWICLVTLSMGVAVVVLDKKDKGDDDNDTGTQSMTKGLIAVSVACLSSGLAGVYFEKVIKTPAKEKTNSVSVWMRNIQLAFFSILTGIFSGMLSNDQSRPAGQPYLYGFTGWAWVLVFLQAGGGMLVAAIIKYADNVLKGLATGVSVCVATGMSFLLFGTHISSQFLVGAAFILTSVYFFSNPIKKKELSHRLSTPQFQP